MLIRSKIVIIFLTIVLPQCFHVVKRLVFARKALPLWLKINKDMDTEVVKIDIRQAISSKMPKASRWIPGFVYRWLARLIRQDELNRVLVDNRGLTGSAFAAGALRTLGVTVKVAGEDNIPDGGRHIFVSNHPLGGLDGIGLIAFLGKRYGDDQLRFLVNDVLMAVKPLGNVFLPVNKYGSQSRGSMRAVDEAYSGDVQIGTFPAGLCSREGADGKVRDLEWKKSFVVKSRETHRDVIPIYFSGLNSRFFYKFAKFRKKLGIKFNIELILLPGEMVKNRGVEFEIRVGKPIAWTEFTDQRSTKEWADEVKRRVYDLADKHI